MAFQDTPYITIVSGTIHQKLSLYNYDLITIYC